MNPGLRQDHRLGSGDDPAEAPRQRRAVLRQEHRKTDRHPRGADG